MRSEERVIEAVLFTREERDAIKTVANLDCNDILCYNCPLSHGDLCIRDALNGIADKLEVYDE